MRTVIATGVGISIVSLALAEKLNSPKRPWDGATLANGIRTKPTDAVDIEVRSRSGGLAVGPAAIMEMAGIDLLLGNNFLRQFKQTQIAYEDPGSLPRPS